jgi:two-component system alkaline phosphatase synthesis response regulator PhoP
MDILIVDDEPFIQRSLAFVLRKAGFEVEVASDGKEGLRKVRELNPKIIYLDLMMPGLSGFEVCETIKSDEKLKDIHVVILTAKGQDVDKDRGIAAGADEFMTKPFSPKEVVEKTTKILRET